MSSLDKAKALLRSSGKLALHIVPLAMLAVSAHATTAFTSAQLHFSGGGCENRDEATPIPGFVASSPLDESNGITGLKIYTSSPCVLDGLSGSGGILFLTAGGDITGSFAEGTVMPVSLAFTTVSDSDLDLRVDFGVTFSDFTGTLSTSALETQFDVPSNGLHTFSYNHVFATDVNPLWWLIELYVYSYSGTNLTLDVPQHSIDLNPASAAEVPEPSSFLLLAPAAAWMFYRRRTMTSQA